MSLPRADNVDLNQYGYNSLRAIKEDGSIINMADIQGARIRSGSIMGRVTLTASATALRINSSDLTYRNSLTIINDSSSIVFIDFNSAVNTSTSFLLNTGTGTTFYFDPNDPVTLYALTTENETNVGVWEMR